MCLLRCLVFHKSIVYGHFNKALQYMRNNFLLKCLETLSMHFRGWLLFIGRGDGHFFFISPPGRTNYVWVFERFSGSVVVFFTYVFYQICFVHPHKYWWWALLFRGICSFFLNLNYFLSGFILTEPSAKQLPISSPLLQPIMEQPLYITYLKQRISQLYTKSLSKSLWEVREQPVDMCIAPISDQKYILNTKSPLYRVKRQARQITSLQFLPPQIILHK